MNILRRPSAGIHAAILAFNALLIGAMWVAVLEIVSLDRRETINTAVERNNSLAIALEEYAERILENADATLRLMIREYSRSDGIVDLDTFVADYTVGHKAYTGIVIADEHGRVSTTAYRNMPAKPVNVEDREHFRVHLAADSNTLFVGKPV